MRSVPRIFLGFAFLITASATTWADVRLDHITLPDGFRIHLYADGVDNARGMVLGDKGTLFVGSRKEGQVYAVLDTDGDHAGDQVIVIARYLDLPVGVAFRDGALYVSAETKVLRFDDIENRLDDPPKPVVVRDGFPDEHHGWKYLAFSPDDKLYFQIGAPCNICDEGGDFATIARMNPDGSDYEVYARGVRNSVGFDWHPVTGDLWFTDNGRDWLGDDIPADELNRAPEAGMNFGFPYCHAGDIPDPEFAAGHPCSEFTPPARKLGAHVAPLGMTFYTGDQFPPEYRNQIFIAEHGSWNRSSKSGYRITQVRLDADRVPSYEPFAEGWLQGQDNWGRPAALLVLPDGSLLVSDDQAGAVYRIVYEG